MKSSRRPSWLDALGADAAPTDNPIAYMQLVVQACAGVLDPQTLAPLRAGVERWAHEGGSFDEAMGWKAPRGGRNKTAHARFIQAARLKALRTLIVPLCAQDPQRVTAAILSVVRGESPAPSSEARLALAELESHGVKLPQSARRLRPLVLSVWTGNPDMTSKSDG